MKRFCQFLAISVLFFQVIGADPHATVMTPMRDGTQLPTDLYFPGPNPSDYPCVLIRSPSGRTNPFALEYLNLLKEGYVVAIQDTRSALDKEGKTFPFWSDGWGMKQDGYDTIEWLAKSPYSNGKIGTVGVSALGITQYMSAPTAPPSLKCQYVGVAASNLYDHAMRRGGQIQKEMVESWLSYYASDPGVHCFVTNQVHYNDFWEQFNVLSKSHDVKTPTLHFGGWYDIFLDGTLDAFTSFHNEGGEGARGKQKLLIGPWTHLWPHDPRFGDFQMPEAGKTPPVDLSHTSWLAYHLKGVDNGMNQLPSVTYYVMGPLDGSKGGNFWRHAENWPIPHIPKTFYLKSDHTLSLIASKSEESLSYVYDPLNPMMTHGGRNLFMESGPKDQQLLEKREDCLIFTTDFLEEEMEITGKPTLKLFVDSENENDIIVKLTDVYPDGKSILITEGIAHVSTPEVNVELAPTSMVFAKGHRIRISISSSNYPRYEKNHKSNKTTVYFSDSKLTLPLIQHS